MKISINTAVFLDQMNAGHSQYEVLQTLIGKPIANIEVRGEFFQDDTRDAELAKISDLAAENGWGLYYSIPEALFDDGKLNPHLQNYLTMATKFGIKNLKISLGDAPTVDASLKKTLLAIPTDQVSISVENEPNAHGEVDKIVKFLRATDQHFGYTFDSGNWYWIKQDPQTAMDQLQSMLTIFHLKNIKNLDTTMLDDGATDWVKLTQKVPTGIPVFLEYNIPTERLLDSEIAKVNRLL
ncbi:sugar phosphate isomerase/epimerase family protein [Limosilactobacillus caecicola]|uniref:sugar phosphate isomerase/epimerase family protein n=1 Tax=Limosilactobacillus caecicola TaxID=2941332 RepID=UPI0020409075|nr:sugar phosphate isomerase/epimerase [Limosilactobacillus caecicola]